MWRASKAGFAFAFFGLGALAVVVVATVRSLLRPGDDAGLFAQRGIHAAVGVFLRVAERLDLLAVRVHGAEALDGAGPRLLVANHPTGLDVLLVASRLRQVDCIVKESWASVPFAGWAARTADYIVSANGPESVAEAVQRLARGRTVLVFPEGTRSPRDGLLPFQRGAAHIALESGLDIVPLVIRADPPDAYKKGWKWWRLPPSVVRLEAEVCAPLSPKASLAGGETRSVAVRAVTADLQTFYEERLGFGD